MMSGLARNRLAAARRPTVLRRISADISISVSNGADAIGTGDGRSCARKSARHCACWVYNLTGRPVRQRMIGTAIAPQNV
jgi:hypothetical protein